MTTEEPVIRLWELTKTYGEGAAAVHALRGVTLSVYRGDYVAIMGASGSGKSTLMSILGCLDVQTTGRYLLDGIDVETLYDKPYVDKSKTRVTGPFTSRACRRTARSPSRAAPSRAPRSRLRKTRTPRRSRR